MKLMRRSAIVLFLIYMVNNFGKIDAMQLNIMQEGTFSGSESDDEFVLVSGEDADDGGQQRDYPMAGKVLAPFFGGARVESPVKSQSNGAHEPVNSEQQAVTGMGVAQGGDKEHPTVVEMDALYAACMAAKIAEIRAGIGFGTEKAYVQQGVNEGPGSGSEKFVSPAGVIKSHSSSERGSGYFVGGSSGDSVVCSPGVVESANLKKRVVGDGGGPYGEGELKEFHVQGPENKNSLDHEKERGPRCCGVSKQSCCCL